MPRWQTGITIICGKKKKTIIEKIGMENNVASEIARYSNPLNIVKKIGEF